MISSVLGAGSPLGWLCTRMMLEAQCAMAQRITEMLTHPERAREMGQAGHKRAQEHFTWEAIGEKTMALYEKVIAQRHN